MRFDRSAGVFSCIGLISLVVGCSPAVPPTEQARSETPRSVAATPVAPSLGPAKVAQPARKPEPTAEQWNDYRSHLLAAETARQSGDVGAAKAELAACSADMRGWEHGYLSALLSGAEDRLLGKSDFAFHGKALQELAFVGNTSNVFSGGMHVIAIWDQQGLPQTTFEGSGRGSGLELFGTDISPDGRWIAAGRSDGSIDIWNAANRDTPETVLTGATTHVCGCIRFSRDGSIVVAYNRRNAIRIWDRAKATVLHSLPNYDIDVRALDISPDGSRIVAGVGGGVFKVWTLKDAAEVWSVTGFPGRLYNSRFSPDGSRIACSGSDFLEILDAADGKSLVKLSGQVGGTVSLAFSPDGRRLAGGGEDKTIRIWDVATGQELLALAGHASRVGALAFSADGRKLISGDWSGSMRLWDAGADPATSPAAK